MKLLIVNDMEITVDFLVNKVAWKEYGVFDVYKAYNADEAKSILSDIEVDILLCDIEMPGENGLDLLQWVQQKHLSCDCIFLTCHANFEYIHEALQLDCRDYILFPTTQENIGEAVQKVYQRRIEQRKSANLQEYGKQWIEIHHINNESNYNAINSSQDIIENTINYILQNISDPELNVNKLAEKNYLSLSYLSRLFKKKKGVSISQYIIKHRMQLSAELLENTLMSVSTIAIEVGYDNYPYFTSTFKKEYGCTPSQYRDQHFKKL